MTSRPALSLLLASALAVAAPSKNDDDRPPIGLVYGERDLSRTYFSCLFVDRRGEITPTKTQNIRCDFTQVLFTMPKPEEVAAKVAKFEGEFESGWKEALSKGEVTVAMLQKECAGPESKQFAESERRRIRKNGYAATMLPSFEASLVGWNRLCACKDLTCLHDVMKANQLLAVRSSEEECGIFATAYKLDFAKQGSAWVKVQSNPGLCYISTTTTLSRAPDSGTSTLWNLRTTKVPKPEPSKLCTNQVEDTLDTWNSYPSINLTCKGLKL